MVSAATFCVRVAAVDPSTNGAPPSLPMRISPMSTPEVAPNAVWRPLIAPSTVRKGVAAAVAAAVLTTPVVSLPVVAT